MDEGSLKLIETDTGETLNCQVIPPHNCFSPPIIMITIVITMIIITVIILITIAINIIIMVITTSQSTRSVCGEWGATTGRTLLM